MKAWTIVVCLAFWGLLGRDAHALEPGGPDATESSPENAPSRARNYLKDATVEPAAETSHAPSQSNDVTGVSIALVLLLALSLVALYAKRRKGGSAGLRNQIRLHSLGSLALGPKSKIALLSVGREALLLGVTESGITCLRTYPEDELWCLTSALPGFGDMIREQEEQAKLAQRPMSERSAMDLGMSKAFSDILSHAGRTSEASAQVHDSVRNDKSASKLQRSLPSSADDELPPHLVALLAETQVSTHSEPQAQTPSRGGTVVRFPNNHSDAFGVADGQAADLARRFLELTS